MRLPLATALVAVVLLAAPGAASAQAPACSGAATALTFGSAPSSGAIASGETDCFTFSASSGDRVRIRVAETAGALTTFVTLHRPNDTIACGPSKGTNIDCPLNATGTWTIAVEDLGGTATGDYAIAIQRLNNPSGCTTLSAGSAPTTRSILAAAEMDCFRFTGVAGARMRVRLDETSGSLVARTDVARPAGTIVCGGSTTTNRDCATDIAGTHTILVADNAGTATGSYGIAIQRLDSPAGCTTIAFGAAAVSGTVTNSAEMDCYRFTGATGDRVFFRFVDAGGGVEHRKEVVRPAGTTVCAPSLNEICGLDATGTHTIVITDDAGSADYTLAIQRINDPVGCTVLGFGATPATGTASPAEVDCFTFTGAAGDQIRRRVVLTSGEVVGFDLYRPNGTEICFGFTAESDDSTCELDSAGTHAILVTGGSAGAGYRLAIQRLNDPVGCTPIDFGAPPTTAAIGTEAEMDCYTFDAEVGDSIRALAVATSSSGGLSLSSRIVDPSGVPVNCPPLALPDCDVDTTGTHAIVVADQSFNGDGTGGYALAIQRMNDPVGCTPLSFGAAPVAAAIAVPADMDCYTFSATAGSRFRITLPVTAGALTTNATVHDPTGARVCTVPGDCTLNSAGTHAIVVRESPGGPVAVGDYAVAIQRLGNPVGCTTISGGGTPTETDIGAAGEMDCYSLSATPGNRIRIRLAAVSGAADPAVAVIRPNGTLVCSDDTALDVTCSLDATGQHRLIVGDAGSGPGTGEYAISLQRLNNPCPTIAFGGTPLNGTIDAPAELDCLSIVGAAAGDQIRIQMTSGGALEKRAELLRTGGTTVCAAVLTAFTNSLTCLLDVTGTARILIGDTDGTQTGAYTIAVQRANDPVGCGTLSFGAAPATGTIAAAGELDCFRFSAAAGDRVAFKVTGIEVGLSARGELLRPNGTPIGCSFGCSLDTTGTFTLLVHDFDDGTGDYALGIQRLSNPVGCSPIAFGALPTAGTIGVPAEQDCFTFTAAAGDRIHLEAVATSGAPSSLRREVFDPAGTRVCIDQAAFSCRLASPGRHTIVMEGNGAPTPGYSLGLQRLNAPAGCTVIGFGSPPAPGTIATAAENDCFTFTGAPGDRIRLRSLATSGTLAVDLEVVRPNGTVVCTVATPGDFTCPLNASGSHTIVVGDAAGAGTGDYVIEVQRLNAPQGCTAIPAIGTPVTGSIDGPAELDCFTVSATAGTSITLQLAETSGALVGEMEVVRPNGTVKCAATTSSPLVCALDTTGTHTVLVGDDAHTNTGGYELTRTG